MIWMLYAITACGPRTLSVEAKPGSIDSGTDEEEPLPFSGEVFSFPLHCEAPAAEFGFTQNSANWNILDTDIFSFGRDEGNPAAFFDVDSDGDDDLLMASWHDGLVLHENQSEEFSLTTVDTPTDPSSTIALGDVDNDGDLDVLTAGVYGSVQLYLNDGSGVFEDGTASWGLSGVDAKAAIRHALFFDMDLDGDMDLHLTVLTEGDGSGNLLYENITSTFNDVSERLPTAARRGYGWSTAAFDADGDGDIDLYTANSDQLGGRSSLALNDGGGFTDVSALWSADAANTMGATVGDYNRDGWPDLYLTSAGGPESLLIHDGYGGYYSAQNTLSAVVSSGPREMTFAALSFDANNDGYEDVYVSAGPHFGISTGNPDSVDNTQPDEQYDAFLIWEDGVFVDRISNLGMDNSAAGRAVVRGFLNDDWAMDLIVTNFAAESVVYEGVCTSNRGLSVELQGVDSNRFGVGSRIVLETSSGVQTRFVGADTGWGSAIHPRAWFGIGVSDEILSLLVYWPSGLTQRADVEAGFAGRLVVVEG